MKKKTFDKAVYVIEDIMENAKDELETLIFEEERTVNQNKFVELLRKRYETYKDNLDDEDRKIIYDYLTTLNKKEIDYLLFLIEDHLCSSEGKDDLDPDKIEQLDWDCFWFPFSIACKKCINNPTAEIVNREDYFKFVQITTSQQREAHITCVEGFGMDCRKYTRQSLYCLDQFMHPIRYSKSIKRKKKNINRVLRRTKKIMQINKLAHRNGEYNIFIGQTQIVPEQFVKYVINNFIE